MNENSTNNINVEIAGIRIPEVGEIWGGAKINLNLTDKGLDISTAAQLQQLKTALAALPGVVKQLMDRCEANHIRCLAAEEAHEAARIKREEERETARLARQKAENDEILADWQTRVNLWEEEKAAFERAHAEWEKKEDRNSFDEPTFYKERPHRPHLSVC